jgi:tyrosine-protein kinase Etk/Wzc
MANMEEMPLKENDATPREDILDLLLVLARRKRLIAGLVLGAALMAAAISLFLSPLYLAETKILPPQTSSSMTAQILSQLNSGPGLLGITPPVKPNGELYVELLRSRTVLDRLVDRFGLMKRYDAETRDDARLMLGKKIRTKNNIRSGIITAGIEDADPVRASAMANALIEELINLNRGLCTTEASQRRLFFEEQLKNAGKDLLKAEEAMKSFQEKTGAVRIDTQAEAVVQGISALRAQTAAKEVQIRVMRTYSTEHNPDIIREQEELKGMREQLSRLELKGSSDATVPAVSIPQASTDYLRRSRDLKFSETLYELLLTQYRTARLEEANDAAIIQVVEKAVPPQQRVWPNRSFMVAMAALIGLFLSFLAVFILEYRENAARNPRTREKLASLRKLLSPR